MKSLIKRSRSLVLGLGVLAMVLLPVALYGDAPSGNGVLSVQNSTSSDCTSGLSNITVGNGGTFDVTGDSTILLTITPEVSICVAGDPSLIGNTCGADSDCNSKT